MTASTPTLQDWADQTAGKVARVALAVAGMALATLVLMYSAAVESGSWALVLLGVAIAAVAVRTATHPTWSRFAGLGVTMAAFPLILQIF